MILPFKRDTPQVRGRKRERQMAQRDGLRLHPASGAGSIKHDASDDEVLMEYKTCNKSFTLSGKYLSDLYVQGVRQGKDSMMRIEFEHDGVTVEMLIRRT